MTSQTETGSSATDKSAAATAPQVDAQRIKHIAHLSRIGIDDQEAEKYAGQMNSVLDYMKILEEVNTEGVEMTLQVTGLKNVTREDRVTAVETPDSLMAVTPLNKISNQIAVRAVIKEE
jgi:aspartyl-tRNA(Asn)/glutamyl-tRNA(Gln) amidotransferase subunit C